MSAKTLLLPSYKTYNLLDDKKYLLGDIYALVHIYIYIYIYGKLVIIVYFPIFIE
jgi:hypothetical protein